MAVAFDAAGTAKDSLTAVTTVSIPITIGTGANRAVVVGISLVTDTLGITATMNAGAETLSVIAGTATVTGPVSVLLGKATALTGAQTVVVSWTNAQAVESANAMSFTGVHQTTPFNNGTKADAVATPASVTVTSISGDLTTTVAECGGTTISTNQTLRWSDVTVNPTAGDTGPGTGTTTHTWTGDATTVFTVSGANIVAAAAASTYGSATADPGSHTPILSRFQ